MNFIDLNTKINNEEKYITFNNTDIGIKQYLSVDKKYEIITLTAQFSEENGILNPIKEDIYFHFLIVLYYTDIVFSEEDKTNINETYDKLVSSGLLNEIIKNISEYQFLLEMMEEYENKLTKYRSSTAGIIDNVINSLPKNAEAVKEIISNFEPEKFQEVINFAESANAGRPIPKE
jgi:hypothetical protein